MLDFDLAALYRVETRTLKQAVRRNMERFPEDFMLRLSPEEANYLIDMGRSQNVIPLITILVHRRCLHLVRKALQCFPVFCGVRLEDLFVFNSLNYEVLKGDKKGVASTRINDKYRLEFTARIDGEKEPIVTVCTIMDITNHYK